MVDSNPKPTQEKEAEVEAVGENELEDEKKDKEDIEEKEISENVVQEQENEDYKEEVKDQDQEVEEDEKVEEEEESRREQTVTIMTVEELASHLDDYQIVDTRPRSKFLAGHIPGSRHMEWEAWTCANPRRLWNRFGLGDSSKKSRVIDDTALIQKKMLPIGLQHDKHIVVVGEPFGWGCEGRVAWNLLYWGAQTVSLLDGGYLAWVDANQSTETGAMKRLAKQADPFKVQLQPQWRATLENLGDNPELYLMDTRTLAEFTGESILSNQKRGGHIPHSKLVPAHDLYQTENGQYVSKERLEELIPEDASDIAYCAAGIRSGLLVVLAKARLDKQLRNYDASLWEWASNPSRPMEIGELGVADNGVPVESKADNGTNGIEEHKNGESKRNLFRSLVKQISNSQLVTRIKGDNLASSH